MIYAQIRDKSIYFPYNDNEIGVLKENRVQRVLFTLNRSELPEEVSEWICTLEVQNSAGESDILPLSFMVQEETVSVEWLVSRAVTKQQGELKIQLCFSEDVQGGQVWKSNIAHCRVTPGIDAGQRMLDTAPQYFEQWQERMEQLYHETAELASSIGDAAEFLAQNREQIDALPSLLQECADVVQDALQNIDMGLQQAQEILQNTSFHSIATQGHSQAAKDARDEAATASLSARAYAESAREITHLDADAFLFCDGAEGAGSLVFVDVHPSLREPVSLCTFGKTVATQQERSMDTPGVLSGVGEGGAIDLSLIGDGQHDEYTLPLSQPLYQLPNGMEDRYDIRNGKITRLTGRFILSAQSECAIDETMAGSTVDTVSFRFPLDVWNIRETPTYVPPGTVAQYVVCSHFAGAGLTCADDQYSQDREMLSLQADGPFKNFRLRINKSRLAGWSEGWNDAQRLAAVRAWLAEHPITVIYALLLPAEEEVAPLGLSLLAPTCTLSVDGTANPWLTARYYRDLSRVLVSVLSDIRTLKNT